MYVHYQAGGNWSLGHRSKCPPQSCSEAC